MNEPNEVPKLHELYGAKNEPWQDRGDPLIRFEESNSHSIWAFPFLSLTAAVFIPHDQPYSQRLILYFPVATIFVAGGPKLMEFYDAFSKQRATLLKADGKEILSVKISLNAVSDGDSGSSGTPEGQGTAQG
jgi:hypothetical protein